MGDDVGDVRVILDHLLVVATALVGGACLDSIGHLYINFDVFSLEFRGVEQLFIF
jgi:hypothetical protein